MAKKAPPPVQITGDTCFIGSCIANRFANENYFYMSIQYSTAITLYTLIRLAQKIKLK